MRILFLSGWFPYPPDNGSKIRIYQLLKGLAAYHDVTLLTLCRTPGFEEYIAVLQEVCHKVAVLPWQERSPCGLAALAALVGPRPRGVVATFSLPMQRLVEAELASDPQYDAVIASELCTGMYHARLRPLPALLEDVELGIIYDAWARALSPMHRLRRGATWAKAQRYVQGMLRDFRACTVVSEEEKTILARAVPGFQPIEVIPNCLDVARYASVSTEPMPATLIFTGSLTFAANYDAVSFFLREMYPVIKAACPEVRLRITGRVGGQALPANLIDSSVELTGYLEDVLPAIAGSWAGIVPLRIGGGTRLKILESLALGTPVVATSKGAEGLAIRDGEHVLVADTPAEFAAATIRLLAEPELRARLAENGRRLVRERYDWSSVMPRFLALVESLRPS